MKKKISAILIMIVALSLGLSGCSGFVSNWIISLDGEKIEESEYLVYLHEQVKAFEQTGGSDIWGADFDGVSAQEVAKQNAANSLLRAKLAVNKASDLGVSTTVDESTVEADGQELYDSITSDTNKRIPLDDVSVELCKSIIRDGLIQQQVYQAVTDSYEINQTDFDAYLQDYYNTNIFLYKNVSVKPLFVSKESGKDIIQQAYDRIKQGQDFSQVCDEYSESNDSEFSMSEDMYNEEIRTAVYSLEKDEFTDIMEYENGYYIFYAKEVSQTTIDEVAPEIEQQYAALKKEEIYQTQNDNWLNSVEVKRNNSVWESISINTQDISGETAITETTVNP